MNNKVWVINRYEFGYNGECYTAYGKYNFGEFLNKEEAEEAYKKLEISKARKFPLSDMEFSMFTSDDQLSVLDSFVFSKCGQHILNNDGRLINEPLTKELSNEDTFAFINMANAHAAQLVELDVKEANKIYWVVFFTYNRKYLNREWVHGVQMIKKLALVSAETIEDIKKVFWSEWGGDSQIFGVNIDVIKSIEFLKLKGGLEKLSHQPLVLKHLIEQFPDYLKYENNVLRVRVCDGDAFWTVNKLLKKPVIDLRVLNEDDLQQLNAIVVD